MKCQHCGKARDEHQDGEKAPLYACFVGADTVYERAAASGGEREALWWLTEPDGSGVMDESCVFLTKAEGEQYISDAGLTDYSLTPLFRATGERAGEVTPEMVEAGVSTLEAEWRASDSGPSTFNVSWWREMVRRVLTAALSSRQDGQETPGTPYKQQEPMSGGSAESWERGKTGLVGSFASIDMDTKRMNWLESEALRDTHYPPPLYRRNQVITRAAVDATMSAAPQLVPLTPTKNEQ